MTPGNRQKRHHAPRENLPPPLPAPREGRQNECIVVRLCPNGDAPRCRNPGGRGRKKMGGCDPRVTERERAFHRPKVSYTKIMQFFWEGDSNHQKVFKVSSQYVRSRRFSCFCLSRVSNQLLYQKTAIFSCLVYVPSNGILTLMKRTA